MLAVHLNHGHAKSSHLRPGTDTNKKLARQLPHPHQRVWL